MSARGKLALDVAMFGALIVANDPARTGIALHEWLGVALLVTLTVHLALNAEATVRMVSRFSRGLAGGPRLNLIVDGAAGFAVATVIGTGLAMSQSILPMIGITTAHPAALTQIHLLSAWASVGLVATHFVLHGGWVSSVMRSLLAPAPGARKRSPVVAGITAVFVTAVLAASFTYWTGAALTSATSVATAAARNTTAAQVVAAGIAAQSGSESGATSSSSSGASNSSGSGTLTCPRTGCTASTCHHQQ